VTFKLGQWLRYADDFEGARQRLDESEQQARDEGDESSLANILLNKLIVETWAGNWREAAELANRMIVAFEQHGVVSPNLELWRVYLEAHLGRLDVVRAAAEGAGGEEPIIAAVWNRSLGLAELAAGHAGEAFAHLRAAMENLDSVDFREPAVWRIEGDAIDAALESGASDRAEAWLERFLARTKSSPIPWNLAVSARCEGLVLAARGSLEPAAEALDRALVEHERCPMPFERARTLLVQGQILRRLKQKREAREALEAARAIFAELDAEPWIARTDAELSRVRTRRAPDELSATERKIAELAADGLSNADIASRMFVSRKTVEANLGRVYRKLGIASRAQLHAALNR
jgi:DNA-binding CsgD family transcriptional regulator